VISVRPAGEQVGVSGHHGLVSQYSCTWRGVHKPSDGATGVDINTPVRMEFSRPVNPARLTCMHPEGIES